ncbi:MAG: hypothetical protein AAF585_17900, partial [Verrucomicrobiota bacterium]
KVRVSAMNERMSASLGSTEVGFGLDAPLIFEKPVKEGERIRVSFEAVEPGNNFAPSVKRQKTGDGPILPIEMETSMGSETLEGHPQIALLYHYNGKSLLWLWLVVLLGFPAVLKWRQAIWPWLLVLGFCAMLTSWLGWQQRYSHHYGHMDPDRYGAAGNYLAEWLTSEYDRDRMAENLRNYQHTHIALVPVTLTGLILAGLDMREAYIFLNAVLSFSALLLFHQLLNRQLRLSWAMSAIGTLLFACHFVFLRSFAKPTTDQAGLLLTLMMVCLLIDRMKRRTIWQTLGLAALVAPLVFVRPPGLAYAAFLIGMAPFCDWLREKKFNIVDHLLTLAKIAVIPLLLVWWIYSAFDLGHNFELAMQKKGNHTAQWTLEWFWYSSAATVQLLIVGWIFLRWRPETWRPILVLALWTILHTALLAAAEAPFIARLMAPILPCVIALACMGLDRFRDHALFGKIAIGALGALAAANLFIQIAIIDLAHQPPLPWANYFYS